MKRFVKTIIGRYVTFLPLIVFMLSYDMFFDWKTSFIIGGTISCLYLLFVFYKQIKNDLFMLGINCFLIGGAIISIFKIRWLGSLYGYFGYSTILVWIFIVGLVATIFSEEGFVAAEHKNKRLVKLFSAYLLIGTLLAIAFSIYFSKQIFTFGALPFIFLFILRWVLVRHLKRGS